MIPFRRRLAGLVVIALICLAPSAVALGVEAPWRHAPIVPPEEGTITVGSSPLDVQLAVRPDQQQLGLGYRNGLAEGTGMLFVFDQPSVQTFWMKGMRFCLDIVWIEAGQITGAAESVCPDPPDTPDSERRTVNSGLPVSYVLEVPAGWLQSHGYGTGTPVEIPPTAG